MAIYLWHYSLSFIRFVRSFVVSMPSGWVFIMFCILLRLTEGVGSAMFATSLYAQLPELFPHSVGTMSVCVILILIVVLYDYI